MIPVYSGVPREKIPWFPTINRDKCHGCLTCVAFCKNDVFIVEENSNPNMASTNRWDKLRKRPKVVHPFNCVVGCSACAKLCPMNAIEFPETEEVVKILRQLMLEYRR